MVRRNLQSAHPNVRHQAFPEGLSSYVRAWIYVLIKDGFELVPSFGAFFVGEVEFVAFLIEVECVSEGWRLCLFFVRGFFVFFGEVKAKFVNHGGKGVDNADIGDCL